MDLAIVLTMAGAGLALALGGIAIALVEKSIDGLPPSAIRRLVRLHLVEGAEDVPYQARLQKSLSALERASKEVDDVVLEVSKLTRERETTIARLEEHLDELSKRENEQRARIRALEKVPLEALRHFEHVLKRSNRRSAKRDYILFAAGVVVSAVIAVLLTTVAQ